MPATSVGRPFRTPNNKGTHWRFGGTPGTSGEPPWQQYGAPSFQRWVGRQATARPSLTSLSDRDFLKRLTPEQLSRSFLSSPLGPRASPACCLSASVFAFPPSTGLTSGPSVSDSPPESSSPSDSASASRRPVLSSLRALFTSRIPDANLATLVPRRLFRPPSSAALSRRHRGMRHLCGSSHGAEHPVRRSSRRNPHRRDLRE